ncbi:sulfotransferase family 2 domain-containing protein [Halobacillus sp. A5]|uniref:sulfotransferase family 2 domain-containing protein n=1 Tax=Halobacillus sp. A5 TaxID=2880263 RepID=UPI0020A67602|nr:sulfotransferase family 2 domain-containing protein [Halobacillus sp. A5]MCP3028403.1 sulfotransferase family 2 domain-containing protein [Halobacillus sp. A5]
MIHFNKEKIDQKELICFLHIPKSGGKTMWKILEEQKEQILVWHGKYFKILKKPTVYFTILRNPVERVISTYFYIRSYERDPLHEQVKNMSFQKFLSYMKDENIRNKQYHKRDIRSIRYRTVNLTTRYLSGGDPDNLKMANYNLNHYFTEVGFTERFSESLFFLKEHFGWEDTLKIKQVNRTQNRPKSTEIPPEIIKEIKRLNHNDEALYKQARRKFEDRLVKLSDQQKQALEVWKKISKG